MLGHAGHQHHHTHGTYDRAFAIGVTLNLAFVVAEVAFGLFAHSLALLSDAGHNLGDVLGLLLAWGAGYLSRRQPTERHTYGLRRSSILAALGNAILLLIAIGGIGWEGLRRLAHPRPVETETVIWVAAVGILVNSITAALFVSGRHRDLNLRGAFLHMVADAAVSAGVVVAGVVMLRTGWLWPDPVVSILIALVIAWGTWGLFREALNLAMDAVPSGIDVAEVEGYLRGLPDVTDVHDLHVWGMSTTENAMTVHLVCPSNSICDRDLEAIAQELHQRFHIEHCTVQVERGDGAMPCKQSDAASV